LNTLLDALALLTTVDWHLHVVGSETLDPGYSASMRLCARTRGLTTRITWHGRVSDDNLRSLLRHGDLLAMPSYEGFGIVFLEAMAHGLPVIAANFGAAPEIITPGVNGYLVPPADHLALHAKLHLLAKNRAHLATLGYFARMRYERHPTWATSMRGACDWLREEFINLSPTADVQP
jgi:glycosyltransferase involved in cell wall biosynthesis